MKRNQRNDAPGGAGRPSKFSKFSRTRVAGNRADNRGYARMNSSSSTGAAGISGDGGGVGRVVKDGHESDDTVTRLEKMQRRQHQQYQQQQQSFHDGDAGGYGHHHQPFDNQDQQHNRSHQQEGFYEGYPQEQYQEQQEFHQYSGDFQPPSSYGRPNHQDFAYYGGGGRGGFGRDGGYGGRGRGRGGRGDGMRGGRGRGRFNPSFGRGHGPETGSFGRGYGNEPGSSGRGHGPDAGYFGRGRGRGMDFNAPGRGDLSRGIPFGSEMSGRGRSGGRGRGFGRGRGDYSRPPITIPKFLPAGHNVPQIVDSAITNLLNCSLTPNFRFFKYSINFDVVVAPKESNDEDLFGEEAHGHDSQPNPSCENSKYEKLYRSSFLTVIRNHLSLHMEKKQVRDIMRSIFLKKDGDNYVILTNKVLPALEADKLPLTMNYEDKNGLNVLNIQVQDLICLSAPENLPCQKPPPEYQQEIEILMDLRCSDCNKAFTSLSNLQAHCVATGHKPVSNVSSEKVEPASIEILIKYLNGLLHQALSERLTYFSAGYLDTQNLVDTSEDVRVARCYCCGFKVVEQEGLGLKLALNVSIKAKLIPNQNLVQTLMKIPTLTESDIGRIQDATNGRSIVYECRGQINIYKIDHVLFVTPDELGLDGNQLSSSSGSNAMSHSEYFHKHHNVLLKHANVPLMVAVRRELGGNNFIYLPGELCYLRDIDLSNALNRLKPVNVPKLASFSPSERMEAVEVIRKYLIPGAHKPRFNTSPSLLPASGVILSEERLHVSVSKLQVPALAASGMNLSESPLNWAPALSKVNYCANPSSQIHMNVVLVVNEQVAQSAPHVYHILHDAVNAKNSRYLLKPNPLDVLVVNSTNHIDMVAEYFQTKSPQNALLVNFFLPSAQRNSKRKNLEYTSVKMLLSKVGVISQFISFHTHNHALDNGESKKGKIVMQAVARQILGKCGARIWWVQLPPEIPLPAVFIGADVFIADKAPFNREEKKNIAACVVQLFRTNDESQQHEVYSETTILDDDIQDGCVPLGSFLQKTVSHALRELKVDPRSVYIWRGGIRDGTENSTEVESLMNSEIDAIRESVSSNEPPPVQSGRQDPRVQLRQSPDVKDYRMSYMLCQKEIDTKFIAPDGRNGLKEGCVVNNLQPTHAHKSFHVHAVAPPYSTPKSVRFVVHSSTDDDIKQVLPQLTWTLCHDYANWTGPVKIPGVVQMAQKLLRYSSAFPDHGASIQHEKFMNSLHFL